MASEPGVQAARDEETLPEEVTEALTELLRKASFDEQPTEQQQQPQEPEQSQEPEQEQRQEQLPETRGPPQPLSPDKRQRGSTGEVLLEAEAAAQKQRRASPADEGGGAAMGPGAMWLGGDVEMGEEVATAVVTASPPAEVTEPWKKLEAAIATNTESIRNLERDQAGNRLLIIPTQQMTPSAFHEKLRQVKGQLMANKDLVTMRSEAKSMQVEVRDSQDKGRIQAMVRQLLPEGLMVRRQSGRTEREARKAATWLYKSLQTVSRGLGYTPSVRTIFPDEKSMQCEVWTEDTLIAGYEYEHTSRDLRIEVKQEWQQNGLTLFGNLVRDEMLKHAYVAEGMKKQAHICVVPTVTPLRAEEDRERILKGGGKGRGRGRGRGKGAGKGPGKSTAPEDKTKAEDGYNEEDSGLTARVEKAAHSFYDTLSTGVAVATAVPAPNPAPKRKETRNQKSDA